MVLASASDASNAAQAHQATMLSKFLCSSACAPPMVPEALATLKDDFRAENADCREEGLLLQDYQRQIDDAWSSCTKYSKNCERLMCIAECYAAVNLEDPRCLEALDELLALGAGALGLQRRGDFWQLRGRCLFMVDRFEESLLAFLKARDCYRENGNKKLRKLNNTALLRVYSALGKSRLAAERLEVALTLCDEHDDTILLYMHAKHSLEQTGLKRDCEVLDDIWFVHLDTNPTLRAKFEHYRDQVHGLARGMASSQDQETWSQFGKRLKMALRECYLDETFQLLSLLLVVTCVLGIALLVTTLRK